MRVIIRDAIPDLALTKPTLKSYHLTVVEEVVGILLKQPMAMLAWLRVRPDVGD